MQTAITSNTHYRHTHSQPKLRVLHLIHSVCHGGIESAMLNWVRSFDPSRVEVHVACLSGDRGLEASFLKAAAAYGVPHVHRIPWTRRKPFFQAARALAELVKSLQIDVVHTHAYYSDVLGAMVKMYTPVRTVATVYVWGKYELHRQIMQAMDWIALRFVDKVTAHCEETRRRTLKLGFRERDVPLLIAGFPDEAPIPSPEQRGRIRRDLGIADDEILLLNVARIHPEKAHDQLLQSFRIVHDRHPKTRLWISGVGWDHLQNELLALRDSLGLGKAVEFIGHRQDLWPLLHAADIMTHPSHVEGVPVAVLYGMSAGLPIVISDVGGVYEVILKDETGLRIPENDVTAFAAAVTGLIENPEQRRELGDAARRFVTTEYSIETACQNVEKVYREVLAK